MESSRCCPVDLKVTGGQVVDQGGHGAGLAEQGTVCLKLATVTNSLERMTIDRIDILQQTSASFALS